MIAWLLACAAPSPAPISLASPPLEIWPAAPERDDELICRVLDPGVDAGGWPLGYRFAWTVDGEEVGDTEARYYPGDTVPAGRAEVGQRWRCEARAFDGDQEGPAGSAEVEIGARSLGWGAGRLPLEHAAELSLMVDPGDSYYGVTLRPRTGDFDGDGRLDLAVSGAEATSPESQGTAGLIWLVPDVGRLEGALPLERFARTLLYGQGNEAAGRSLEVLDLDGDGRDDLAVGTAARYSGDEGVIYLLDSAALGAGQAPLLERAGLRLFGLEGIRLAGGGDVDCDGLDDLLVGTEGRAYLLTGATLGAAPGGAQEIAALADLTLEGEVGFDAEVAWVPDYDGDGCDEVALVGEGGGAHLFESGGLLEAAPRGYCLDEADVWIDWSVLWFNSDHRSALVGGDFDGDGLGDLAVGAPSTGPEEEGSVSLFSGVALSGAARTDLLRADWHFVGAEPHGNLGEVMALAGDVDADGRDDLLIGNLRTEQGLEYGGAAYLLTGAALEGGRRPLDELATQFMGGELQYIGASLSGAGDVDGDGLDDLLFGQLEAYHYEEPLRVWLVRGR